MIATAAAGIDPQAAHIAAMIEPKFLAEAGWDPATRVSSLRAEHPLLGWRACLTRGMPTRSTVETTCAAGAGSAMSNLGNDKIVALGAALARRGDPCGVAACERDRGPALMPRPRRTAAGSTSHRSWPRRAQLAPNRTGARGTGADQPARGLRWDCLEYDENRSPVLVYDNHKNARLGRRLPIAQDTEDVINDQKERVRAESPLRPV